MVVSVYLKFCSLKCIEKEIILFLGILLRYVPCSKMHNTQAKLQTLFLSNKALQKEAVTKHKVLGKAGL